MCDFDQNPSLGQPPSSSDLGSLIQIPSSSTLRKNGGLETSAALWDSLRCRAASAHSEDARCKARARATLLLPSVHMYAAETLQLATASRVVEVMKRSHKGDSIACMCTRQKHCSLPLPTPERALPTTTSLLVRSREGHNATEPSGMTYYCPCSTLARRRVACLGLSPPVLLNGERSIMLPADILQPTTTP